MRSPELQSGLPQARGGRAGSTRALAVPAIGAIFALGGVVVGGMTGNLWLDAGLIQPGTSSAMPAAAVATLGGAIAWLVSVLTCLSVFRHDAPPTRAEAAILVLCALAALGAGFLLAQAMPNFEDRWKDPRMFRLQRLIWLDAALAAGTCLIVASRRAGAWSSILLTSVLGSIVLGIAAWQFWPFFAACAPIAGGTGCRAGF
ncbi:MAG TPA: hypothetical protein VF351_03785 [Actinomycetota bacterium]